MATIFSVVNSVLQQPLPVPQPERLVLMHNSYPRAGVERASNGVPDYYDRLRELEAFDEQAPYNTRGLTGGIEGDHAVLGAPGGRQSGDRSRGVGRDDLGYGLDDAPRAARLAVEGIAQAVLISRSAFERTNEFGGPLTARGRSRQALQVWLQAYDRLERGLRLVGLERKSKPVNPLDRLRCAVAEANR